MADDITWALREVGERIRAAAALFSGWSERIPASGHVEDDSAGRGVRIVFGGPPAPHAITFEAPHAPFWKHPVFARGPRPDWNWAPQIPPRRFLLPATEANENDLPEVFAQLVDKWALEFGWRNG
jgi:hypothetical protein